MSAVSHSGASASALVGLRDVSHDASEGVMPGCLGIGNGCQAWLSGLAALSTAVALVVLCIEVDENPATRNHLWILVGMIAVSLAIETVY